MKGKEFIEDETNEMIKLLERNMDMFTKINQFMCSLSIVFDKEAHTELATLVSGIPNHVISNGYAMDYFELSQTLIEYRSRFPMLRFTAKQLNDYRLLDSKSPDSGEILDYYQEIDKLSEDLNSNLENLKKLQDKLDKKWLINPLPENWIEYEDELEEELKDPIKFRHYVGDILNKINQAYETVNLFSLFLLIEFRKMKDQETQQLEKDFRNGKKLKITHIYSNQKRKKNQPLLRDYLLTFQTQLPQIVKIFDWIFLDEGIRALRNITTHNLGEKGKCEIEDLLIVIFYDSTTEKYRFNDLANIYRELQTIVFTIYFINHEVFLNFFIHMMKNARDDLFNNEKEKKES